MMLTSMICMQFLKFFVGLFQKRYFSGITYEIFVIFQQNQWMIIYSKVSQRNYFNKNQQAHQFKILILLVLMLIKRSNLGRSIICNNFQKFSKSTTHLLITNWLDFPLDIQCTVKQPKQWVNPHRPDLNINRILDPYSSVNTLQLMKPLNTCYSIGNYGQFKCTIDSTNFGRAQIYCSQVNAYGVWAYDLFYGMYSVRHRTGLSFNIYEIKSRDIPNNSQWMQKLLRKKPQVRINEITMPGSHDSGMIINRFSFLKRLTQNQYEDILGQLRAGVRYFDLRFTFKNGQFVVYHGNDLIAGLGISLQSVIVDVNAFLQHYGQKQTIFFIISKTRKQLRPSQRHELITKLKNQLKNAVLCKDVQQQNIIYQKLGKYCGKVILFYDNEDFVGYSQPILKFKDFKKIQESIQTRRDTLAVYDSYSNTNMIQNMVKDQNEKLQKYGGYGQNYLFLYSFTLTVQSQLRLSLQRYSIELLANISRARLPLQIQKMKTGQLKKPNIIYYDFIDAWSCSAIIQLNQ